MPRRARDAREIVERLTRAHAVLDAQTERIRQLATSNATRRDACRTAGRIDAVEVRLPAGEAALTALDRYAPSASQTVRGNVVEAAQGPCRGSSGRGQRHRVAAGRRHGQGRERHASRARRRDRRDGPARCDRPPRGLDCERPSNSFPARSGRPRRTSPMPARPQRRPDSSREPDRCPPVRGRTCAGRGAGRSRLARRIPPQPQHGHRGPAARRRGARGGPRGGRRAPAPRGRGDGIDPHRGFRGGSGRGLRRDAGGVSGGVPGPASRRPNETSPTRKPSSAPILPLPPKRPNGPSASPTRRIGSPTTTSTTGTRAARLGPATWR